MRQKPDVKTFIIVNPQAAGGWGLRLWPPLADQLYRTIGPFEYEFTNARGEATMLAGQAVRQGYRYLIAVGGDGTVNEVVNGLFSDTGHLLDPDILVGCLPAGSGTDLWKTLGIKGDLQSALTHLRGKKTRWCDIGRATMLGLDGRPLVRYFCNVADVGLGGEVVSRAKRLPAWSSGTMNYLIASTTAFLSWKPTEIAITVDGRAIPAEPLLIALVANGQYCGGGMWIAPEARLDDGLLNLCCIRPMPKWQFLTQLPRLYAGTLRTAPFLVRMTGREIAMTAPLPLKTTVDGEVPGTVPVKFTVLPKTIQIKV